MKRYFKNLLIAIDQFVNALFGGYCDETISAVCYRRRDQVWFRTLKLILDFVLSPRTHDHCFESYKTELYRKQLLEK